VGLGCGLRTPEFEGFGVDQQQSRDMVAPIDALCGANHGFMF
jgi:hypothetical protein